MSADEQDCQTAAWMRDLDNFGRPPPPKRFLGDKQEDAEFLGKVKKFQEDMSHPYASKGRVDVAKVSSKP